MATVAVNVRRHRERRVDLPADLARARRLAKLMDSQFSIAGIRFGLDGLIGLVPGVGDTLTLVGALYPLYLVRKHELGARSERRMIRNIAIDYFAGLIPVLGDVFDVYFKANLKNLAILEEAATTR